jgi:hypothetical protein
MSSITCGNCGKTHSSAYEVRHCYGILTDPQPAPAMPRFRKEAKLPLTVGIYSVGETVFKVYPALNGGHLLAKKLELQGLAQKPTWVYQGAATRFVQAEQLMNLEQAKEFGRITGVCAMCGRMLTDEQSIAAGIGPVCANRVGF